MLAIPRAVFSQWSAELGANYNLQSGSFVAPCGCTFANGNGYGYHAALSYDFISFAGLALGLKPGFEFENFTSVSDYGTNPAHQQVSLNYFSIGPYARFTIPFLSFFVQVTPEVQYTVGNSFERSPAFHDEPADTAIDVQAQRYAAAVSVGYRFHLALLDLAPMVTADYPLTVLRSTNASDWKVTVVTLSLATFF